MKRTLLLSIATLAFGGLLAAPGFAQNPNTQGAGPGVYDPNHPRVNEVNTREQNQQNRIANGMKSGELTPKEAGKLENQQQRIDNSEKKDMAAHNGHLTKGEQARLNKRQNKASKNIYAKKHNAAVR
jgi:CRISPR/Cas system-associated endoribonuclease Cas2